MRNVNSGKERYFVLLVVCMVLSLSSLFAQKFGPSPESFRQYSYPDWFRDAKFGIWAHWGPQAVPRQGDWYAKKMYLENDNDYKYHVAHYGHPSKFGYKDIIPLWKA
jgi:alpha-L-fucosidase